MDPAYLIQTKYSPKNIIFVAFWIHLFGSPLGDSDTRRCVHPVLGCCAVPPLACAALPTRVRGQLPEAKRQINNSFQKTGNHFRQATANMFLQRDFPESGPCARSQLRATEPLTLIPCSIFPPDSFRIWASTSRAKLTHRTSWFEFEETLVFPPPSDFSA